MSSLQVLTRSIDRRLVTPKRLGEVVDLGDGGSTSSVASLIGSAAVTANPAEARLYIDMATEKVEKMLDGRILYRQSYRFRTEGSGRKLLALDQWPAEREGLVVDGSSFDYTLNEDDTYLYRDGNWRPAASRQRFTGHLVAGTEADSYRIDHVSGYLMPGQTDVWTADRDYIPNSSSSVGNPVVSFGSWVRPSDPTVNELYFECVTAGATSAAEPTWPTATTWFHQTVYAAGDWVLPPRSPIHLWYEVTTGGTSADLQGEEPVWPLVPGEEVVDGTVTLTAREQLLFPEGPGALVWAGHFTEELSVNLQHLAALLAIELAKLIVGQPCKDDECAIDFVEKLRLVA